MKLKRMVLTGIVGALLVVSGYALRGFDLGRANLISNANAQEQGRRCSLKTLKGAYGIKFEGEKIETGKFVSVSRITFDGNGSFTTSETGRFNGDPIQRTFTGPYVVNDDCTGFLDFTSHISTPPHAAHGDFVIVNNGQEFFVVDNEEGWAANGVGKRIN